MVPWASVLLVVAIVLAGCSGAKQPPALPDSLPSVTTTGSAAPPPPPTLSIVADPASPKVGQAVIFQLQAEGLADGDRVSSVAWRFGDGGKSSERSPIHVYRNAHAFTVVAQATTAMGSAAEAKLRLPVLAAGASGTPGPGALVPPTPSVDLAGSLARFSFKAPYEPDAVHWSFGDGSSSAEPAPHHAYLATGTFTVTLEVQRGAEAGTASLDVDVTELTAQPRVVVGLSDSGVNPYHAVYFRPEATAHPCTHVVGYADCSIPALPLSVGPGHGSYDERLRKDQAVWDTVRAGQWYWIPQTALIAVHCPEPYTGDATDTGTYDDPVCILDDTQTHGTQTTSSVLSEAPDAWLVFNEGSNSALLAESPVPIDIESNSWGSLAPLYAGYLHAAGVNVCNDSIESPTSIKLRSAGNNGPVPNMGDCWRNGYRTYSVSGGYPSGQHGELSGSTPDFASYWCRPVADPRHDTAMDSSCGTSFAAPTAAGAVAAALLEVRRAMGYVGGSTTTEVAPGLTHEAFMDAVAAGATYDPTAKEGFPASSLAAYPVGATPWLFWGWGWLQDEQVPAIVSCAMGRDCPDNKSAEAWAFNDVRRGFAADG